jgi:hypothetical protein
MGGIRPVQHWGCYMPRQNARSLRAIGRALKLITEAMDLLDAHGGPPDAAAHLSLAQDRLKQFVEDSG